MSKKTFDELCDEIQENVRKDRKRLEEYLEHYGTTKFDDPELAAAVADSIVEISDKLTKANAQLVLIASLQLKKEQTSKNSDEDPLSDSDVDGVYDEIDEDLETN